MVFGESPEWLPSGFTEKVKYKSGRKFKYYYNVATGAKYYSKKDVLSYTTAENGLLGTPQKSNGDGNELSSNSEIDAELDKPDDSPKWLPDGWTVEEKTRQRGSRRGSVYKVYTDVSSGNRFYSRAAVTRYLNTIDHANTMTVQTKMDEPLPHMSPQCLTMTNTGDIPQEKKEGNSFKMLDKVDEQSPNCLSITNTGGTLEENKLAKVDEPSPHMTPQCLSMTNTGDIPQEKKEGNSFKMVDEPYPNCLSITNTGGTLEENKLAKVDEPSPHMTPQFLSMTNTGSVPTKKKKGSSFKPVSTESSAADELPPGWIKEIITSKSGNKFRKDPYYTDPISGYVFRSKLDALRYLETNDIHSCAIRPKKRESSDLNLVKNEIPSSSPAHEKLQEHKGELFVGGESIGCGESSSTKDRRSSEAKILKQTISNNDFYSDNVTSAGADCIEQKILCVNPIKNSETPINPEPENKVPKDEPTAMDVNAAVSPPVTNASAKQQPSECVMEKQTDKTRANLKNPRKRKVPNLASRTSKRRSEPEEMPSNSVLNKCSLREAAKISSVSEVNVSSASGPMPSDIEPAKEASSHEFLGDEAHKEIEPLKGAGKHPKDNPIIPHEQTDGNASENKQESQLCFDFGDSWSDPLEFALRTLRGEIPIDDTLAFPGCFNENLSIPYNNNQLDGCLRPFQSDVPNIFQNEVAPNSGSSKQQSDVDPLPASSSSFSAFGNIGFLDFHGVNGQSSTDAGKKDSQTKFNP